MAAKLHNYSSIADIQEFWQGEIAPRFFDFDDTNLFKIGAFGYINEVMSVVTADVFNTVNIAKREFYPSTAQNISSFYKLAGVYDVDIPMASPAQCNAILYIREKDIIENSTIVDGTHSFVLDNTMTIMADAIQFTFDYPIRIMAKYLNGAYSYTTYYDTTQKNSMHKSTVKYIQNKAAMLGDERYLLMSLTLQQYTMSDESQVITKNSEIETVNAIFQYSGEIAGFDVYYTANPGSSIEEYIPAISANDITPAGAYCIYDFLADNKIRLTFPKNAYFSPKLNSEVRLRVYTSLGSDGNFDEFLGDLICSSNSDTYPYNNSITVRGTVNGKSSEGKNKTSDDDFIREIREKACTNSTITNSSDLQIYFNRIVDDSSVRVEFSKSRDDALQRLYSSFILFKDDNGNIIPTNTCDLMLRKSQFDIFENDRGVIRPGKVFEYSNTYPNAIEISDILLSDDLDIYDTGDDQKFLFTNPFLICVSVSEGIIGYYGNSISEIKQTDFTFVEDRSFQQFICLGLQVERNPIAGESFYTFTVKISSSSSIESSELITVPDESEVIRAKYSGRVIQNYFKDGAVWCKVEYDNPASEDERYQDIQVSTYTTFENGEFVYHIGNEMQFAVLDRFIQNDIIAKKKVSDLGKVRANLDFNGTLLGNMLYIPMNIEGYDSEKDIYILKGYISTNDYISLNQTMLLDYGLYNYDGTPNNNVSIPMEDLVCTVSIFYKDDTANYQHDFSNFEYFKNYTMTNQYTTSNGNNVDLIRGITFIRSTLTFTDTFETVEVVDENTGEIVIESTDDYLMKMTSIPIVKSNWIKVESNFDILINKIYKTYDGLFEAYFELENQYGITMAFFNTYGTSKRYQIGNATSMEDLTRVNCSMSVGIELDAMTVSSLFIEKYRTYLKDKIESLNNLDETGKTLYILDLLAESKTDFPEIVHIEYYGFNEYGYGAQIIVPKEDPSTTTEVQTYIPEFINIYSYNLNGVSVPKIDIRILNQTALS